MGVQRAVYETRKSYGKRSWAMHQDKTHAHTQQGLRLEVLTLFECESFGTTATEHGYRLITALSLHYMST